MSSDDRHGPFWDFIEGRRPLPAVSQMLGWKLPNVDAKSGRIRVEFLARKEFANAQGAVQGGILTAMLDDAMAAAVAASSEGKKHGSDDRA